GHCSPRLFSFFFADPAPSELYPLSLHDALPISATSGWASPTTSRATLFCSNCFPDFPGSAPEYSRILWSTRTSTRRSKVCANIRSEEHTSELQSQSKLVCRLLLEKKKKHKQNIT